MEGSCAPRMLDDRECDFAELLAALHELVDSQVAMLVFGVAVDASHLVMSVKGRVGSGCELGEDLDAPVGFDVGGTAIVVCEGSLVSARREEYVDADGARWLVVGIQYLGGASLELVQVPERG